MLTGETVSLRPIQPADIERLRRWESDPIVMAEWGLPRPLLPHDAFQEDLAGRFRSFDRAGYFMIETEMGTVGRIDFEQLDQRHGSAEIALYIGEIAARRRGFARDAIRTLTAYLFEQRGLHRLELSVIETNLAARRLYERLGFQVEGTLRDHLFLDDAYHDEILMALHRNRRTSE